MSRVVDVVVDVADDDRERVRPAHDGVPAVLDHDRHVIFLLFLTIERHQALDHARTMPVLTTIFQKKTNFIKLLGRNTWITLLRIYPVLKSPTEASVINFTNQFKLSNIGDCIKIAKLLKFANNSTLLVVSGRYNCIYYCNTACQLSNDVCQMNFEINKYIQMLISNTFNKIIDQF